MVYQPEYKKADNFTEIEWKKVHVGSILKIEEEDPVPADLLIIYSSDPSGTCYVETKNLDGETNLKSKYVVKELIDKITEGDKHQFNNLKGKISCELPNKEIYKFEGSLKLNLLNTQ